MLEIIKIGKVKAYPNRGKDFRHLLLRDTKTGLEGIYSLLAVSKRVKKHFWWHIVEELESGRCMFGKMEGEIVEHTEKVLGKDVTLNAVLIKGQEMERDEWISCQWNDQYNKIIDWDLKNRIKWLWSKEHDNDPNGEQNEYPYEDSTDWSNYDENLDMDQQGIDFWNQF